MNHLDFTPTPISRLNYFSEKLGCNILCKRDDLFAEAGGGSKARMLQYILADVNPSKIDVLVTAGGPCSNFNRACALMCAKIGVPMHLVVYTDEPDEWNSLNFYLCQLSGIRCTKCEKADVPQTLKDVVNKYEQQGLMVKQIYGGGKSVEGFTSYYEAVKELSSQINTIDYLFVACGTGTTLTGICAGMHKMYPNAKVYAISTARSYENEFSILTDDMRQFNEQHGTNYNLSNLAFHDEFLCGGYAKYNDELMNCVKESLSKEGMIIDPTYSGKAFYGMEYIIKKTPELFLDKTILFWNTGGVFNLLSTKKQIL